MEEGEKYEKSVSDLYDKLVTQREKFIYYMIALAVTAIGFSVVRTADEPLNLIHIPLGIAALSWLLSIHYGFSNIVQTIGVLRSNLAFFYIKQGINPMDGTGMPDIENPTEIVEKSMKEGRDRSGKYFNRQKWFLYLGMLSFVTWHLLEMYCRFMSCKTT